MATKIVVSLRYGNILAKVLSDDGQATGEVDARDVLSSSFERIFDFKVKLDGLTGAQSLPILAEAVETLGTEEIKNYWIAIPGNVGKYCERFLMWAMRHQDAVWKVEV